MARQVLELSGLGGEGWSGAVLVDAALVEGGATAWLRSIRRNTNSLQVLLSATETGSPDDPGPAFTDALEQSDVAFTFGDGADTLVLKGPGHEGNTFADPTEPYYWTPDNTAAFTSWFGGAHSSFTLTLDDGQPDNPVRGTVEAGAPEARARVDVVPALTLADFDAEGLTFDVLALLRAGAGPNDTIFAAPPRGTVGALLAGELGLGETEAAITRIRRRGGGFLVVNDNDPLSLADYFNPGGAGATLMLHVQTRAGVASIAASEHGRAGDGMIHFGPLGSDLQRIVDGIAEGDRFIVALARPAAPVHEVRGAIEAAAAEARTRLLRVVPPVRTVRGAGQAEAPEVALRLVRVPVHSLRGVAAAGDAQASARLRLARTLMLRGTAAAGNPLATLRLVRVLPPGLRYARSLRESAPAERLLTALEIRHPAVAQPVRVVNDTVGHTIEGNDYVALRFDARLADDIDGRAPQAELGIDNVGRELTQWVEAAEGGVGATCRVMLVLAIEDPPVEWEVTLDVAGMTVDQQRVTARLGFDPLLGRAAVTLRHDPQTSPGLF